MSLEAIINLAERILTSSSEHPRTRFLVEAIGKSTSRPQMKLVNRYSSPRHSLDGRLHRKLPRQWRTLAVRRGLIFKGKQRKSYAEVLGVTVPRGISFSGYSIARLPDFLPLSVPP